MKTLLRNFLINLGALWVTAKVLPGLTISGGWKSLAIGSLTFMIINILVVPLLKIMFLPLNLLTLGLFSWVVNVLALYVLTAAVTDFKLIPYDFPGASFDGFSIPSYSLNILMVAVVASFLIGLISNFLRWLAK